MSDEIKQIKFNDEFRICPECGYKDGFHTMLKKDKDNVKWLFICPTCHAIFDIGVHISDFSSGK